MRRFILFLAILNAFSLPANAEGAREGVRQPLAYPRLICRELADANILLSAYFATINPVSKEILRHQLFDQLVGLNQRGPDIIRDYGHILKCVHRPAEMEVQTEAQIVPQPDARRSIIGNIGISTEGQPSFALFPVINENLFNGYTPHLQARLQFRALRIPTQGLPGTD